MLKPGIFMIDGDAYAISILTEYEWIEFQADETVQKQLAAYPPAPFSSNQRLSGIFLSEDENHFVQFRYQMMDGRLANYVCDERYPYPWRPVLIPLNKGLEANLLSQENPNGSFTYGGGLYIDAVPVHTNRKDLLTYSAKDMGELIFGDTPEDPAAILPWVFWNGKLVCAKTLLYVDFPTLTDQALVWDLWGCPV